MQRSPGAPAVMRNRVPWGPQKTAPLFISLQLLSSSWLLLYSTLLYSAALWVGAENGVDAFYSNTTGKFQNNLGAAVSLADSLRNSTKNFIDYNGDAVSWRVNNSHVVSRNRNIKHSLGIGINMGLAVCPKKCTCEPLEGLLACTGPLLPTSISRGTDTAKIFTGTGYNGANKGSTRANNGYTDARKGYPATRNGNMGTKNNYTGTFKEFTGTKKDHLSTNIGYTDTNKENTSGLNNVHIINSYLRPKKGEIYDLPQKPRINTWSNEASHLEIIPREANKQLNDTEAKIKIDKIHPAFILRVLRLEYFHIPVINLSKMINITTFLTLSNPTNITKPDIYSNAVSQIERNHISFKEPRNKHHTLNESHSIRPSSWLYTNSTYSFLGKMGQNETAHLKHLTDLVMKYCHIKRLPRWAFRHTPKLEKLNLSNNTIVRLRSKSFFGLHHLILLDLSYNFIQNVSRAFTHLRSLEVLILEHNSLTTLHSNSFMGLNRTTYLNLADNSISNVDIGSFQHLSSLETLIMKNNPLSTLVRLNFFGSRFQFIDMSHVHIRKIPQVITPSIKKLHLAGNYLDTIQRGDLDPYPFLRELHLEQNGLQTLEEDALGRLEYLAILYMGENKLTEVPLSLPIYLRELDLQMNEIKGIKDGDLRGLSSLKKLLLCHNEVSYIANLSFSELTNLRILTLCNNKITTLTSSIFSHLSKLSILNLSNNPISKLGRNAFLGLRKLITLKLSSINDTVEEMQVADTVFEPLSNLKFLFIVKSTHLCNKIIAGGNDTDQYISSTISQRIDDRDSNMTSNTNRNLTSAMNFNMTSKMTSNMTSNMTTNMTSNMTSNMSSNNNIKGTSNSAMNATALSLTSILSSLSYLLELHSNTWCPGIPSSARLRLHYNYSHNSSHYLSHDSSPVSSHDSSQDLSQDLSHDSSQDSNHLVPSTRYSRYAVRQNEDQERQNLLTKMRRSVLSSTERTTVETPRKVLANLVQEFVLKEHLFSDSVPLSENTKAANTNSVPLSDDTKTSGANSVQLSEDKTSDFTTQVTKAVNKRSSSTRKRSLSSSRENFDIR